MALTTNLKSCLDAPCLSMLNQTRSQNVAKRPNFHLVKNLEASGQLDIMYDEIRLRATLPAEYPT